MEGGGGCGGVLRRRRRRRKKITNKCNDKICILLEIYAIEKQAV
jgi:hypothetical protein